MEEKVGETWQERSRRSSHALKLWVTCGPYVRSLFSWREILLANTAYWAYPILRKVLEGCSWSDSAVWVACCWIIFVSADVAYILLHVDRGLDVLLLCVNVVNYS